MKRTHSNITFIDRSDLQRSGQEKPIHMVTQSDFKNPRLLGTAEILILEIDGAQRLMKCRHTIESL